MGVAGNSRQDLDVKELRYQAIENMEVTDATKQADLTVTASTMIADFICGDKVGCHREWKPGVFENGITPVSRFIPGLSKGPLGSVVRSQCLRGNQRIQEE
jgi:hypothetical protein